MCFFRRKDFQFSHEVDRSFNPFPLCVCFTLEKFLRSFTRHPRQLMCVSSVALTSNSHTKLIARLTHFPCVCASLWSITPLLFTPPKATHVCFFRRIDFQFTHEVDLSFQLCTSSQTHVIHTCKFLHILPPFCNEGKACLAHVSSRGVFVSVKSSFSQTTFFRQVLVFTNHLFPSSPISLRK